MLEMCSFAKRVRYIEVVLVFYCYRDGYQVSISINHVRMNHRKIIVLINDICLNIVMFSTVRDGKQCIKYMNEND